MGWLHGRLPIDRTDLNLNNDNANKYSMYNWLRTQSFLQNGLVLKFFRLLSFQTAAPGVADPFNQPEHNHDKNNLFLYRSPRAVDFTHYAKHDFGMAALFGLWLLVPNYHYLLLPAMINLLYLPKRYTQLRYFAYHAELDEAKEQVVFHKMGMFGQENLLHIDIDTLEKVDFDQVENGLMWTNSNYDKRFVFKC